MKSNSLDQMGEKVKFMGVQGEEIVELPARFSLLSPLSPSFLE